MRGMLLIIFCWGLSAWAGPDDDVLGRRVSVRARGKTVPEILQMIGEKAGVHFSYNIASMPKGRQYFSARDEELNFVLVRLLQPHKLTFSVLFGNNIVITRLEKTSPRYTVSGYVTDETTGEKLSGVSVYSRTDLNNAISNQDGLYTLTLPSDSVDLVFYLQGYKSVSFRFYLSGNTTLDVSLRDEQEYTRYKVTARPDQPTRYRPDEFHFNDKTLKQLPVLFGESDVMKGLQLLPGVSSGNDGTIGLNIRGGGPDQNLILLDDVPIYNPSHIYGFFSVFNSDVVRDVRLLKGAMEPRYAGRLSSVIDVRTIDGNSKKLRTQASLGLLSSKLTLDGPLSKKGNTTFMLSGRRSYIDLLYSLFNRDPFSNSLSPFRSSYFFYDANGKINHRFSRSHQLSVSFYTGMDNSFLRNSFSARDPGKVIREKDKQEVFWGNRLLSLRDHHLLGPRLSAWFNLAFTGYNFGNESSYEFAERTDSMSVENSYSHRYISRINSTIASYNTEYRPSTKLALKAGVGAVYYRFDREIKTSDIVISRQNVDLDRQFALEGNAYAELNWKPMRHLQISAGAHAVEYFLKESSFRFLQPRMSLNYKPHRNLLLHAGWQQTAQFLHLLTSNTLGMPLDLWLPSTARIAPETSDALSGGVSWFMGNLMFNAEAFSKRMSGLIEYREQANYIGSDRNWEDKVSSGSGRAWGCEFLAEKRSGRTRGWVSYTLSRNMRQFDGINGGKEFPYKYDRRHNLAVLVSHDISRNIDASLSWVYTSGAAYSLPEQVYHVGSGLNPVNTIYIYGERNNYRFPDYHRLDFSINFRRHREKYTRMISLGAYNVYNRLNPFYITPAYNDEGKRIFEAISLFPVLPSLHYKIQF